MKDLYSAQHYQKFLQKQKKKEKKTAVDEEIEQKAKEIEQQNFDMAHAARKKLERGYQTQKKTTKELLSQGEKLEKASSDAEQIQENVKTGKHLTKKIKEEGRMFNFKIPFVGTIKNAFSSKKEDKKKVSGEPKRQNLPPEEIKAEESSKIPKKKLIPGQEKTDEELQKIYATLKNVKQGAKFQHEEIERQQKNIKNIGERTEKSKKDLEEVTENLKNV